MATGGWGLPNDPGQGGNRWGPPPAPGPYGPPPTPNPYGPPPPPPTPPPGPYRPAPVGRRWYRRVPFLSFLIPLLRLAHRPARKLFDQDGGGRVHDPVVDRVQITRTVLGVLATLALYYMYGSDGDLEDQASESAAQLIVTPVLLLIAGPVVIALFIRYAPAQRRRLLRSRLSVPAKTVGWYVLTVAVLAATLWAISANPGMLEGLHGVWLFVAAVPALVLVLWGLPFFFLASAYVARSAFNTAYVHAALPAVLTVVMVWIIAVFNATGSGMPNGPLWAQLCSLFGGPLSVTGLSLWELHRLRTRHGVTIRG
ncbi:membrane protein [Streptomyces sp. PRh5]|nr:membrane protein [Streptomyces sp. PRh5]